MNKIRNRKNNKGFSLVELIIVIAIMAILAGILIPQFVKYISSSKVSGDIQQAENIYNAVAAQYADSQGNAPVDMTYDGKLYKVNVDVAEALDMGSKAPESKVASDNVFYYSCDTKGAVAVYIGPDTIADGTAIAGSGVTQLSPSIKGAHATDWNGEKDEAL